MDTWLLVSKGIIMLYCISNYINIYRTNHIYIILITLIFMVLNLLYHLSSKDRIKKLMLIIIIITSIAAYKCFFGVFIIFMPIGFLELIKKYNYTPTVEIVFFIFSMFFIRSNIRADYFFVTAVYYLIYTLADKSYKRINTLSQLNEQIRYKNMALNERIHKERNHDEQAIYLSQIEERNKIAQQIHDNIGHTISGSLMQLELAKLIIDKDSEKSKQVIEKVIEVLRDGMENIRVTLRKIKPPPEQLGINRIKLLLNEFTLNGIETSFLYEGNVDKINFAMWKVIYENIKEALTNAGKYSKAANVVVKIEVLNKIIKVSVKDNGVGTINSKTIEKGLGLLGMEERIQSLNGKIIIDGSDGFSIIMLIPSEG
jgi:signal transduction histidine kinase